MRAVSMLLVAAVSLPGAGCEKKAPEPAQVAPEKSAEPEAPKPTRPTPDDLQSASIQQALRCPGGYKPACEVLDRFDKAGAWNLDLIRAEEARYFGKGYAIENDKLAERYYVFVVKKIPLNRVEPGDLPIQVSMRELDPSLGPENVHAPRLLRILERDGAVDNRTNQTAQYIEKYNPVDWHAAAPTKGPSKLLYLGAGAYVRQRADQRTLELVQIEPAKPGAKTADGLFVTLYPLSW